MLEIKGKIILKPDNCFVDAYDFIGKIDLFLKNNRTLFNSNIKILVVFENIKFYISPYDRKNNIWDKYIKAKNKC